MKNLYPFVFRKENDMNYWIWFATIKGLGAVQKKKLLALYETPEKIYNAKIDEIEGSGILKKGISNEIEKSKDVELSSRIEGSNGVYVVPAFVGLGTPYWDNDARGSVFGLTRSTTREHFINATVESIAYQSKDVMEVMKADSNLDIHSLAVDGGASSNNYLMKFQSNILKCKIVRPKCLETTALGAAYLAGLAVKLWDGIDELKRMHKIEQIFMPDMSEEERTKLYKGWTKAVEATMSFKVE